MKKTIEKNVDALDQELRHLSLQIHDNPELAFQERFAHDILTAFVEAHGFVVTRHYLGLETAWRAEFEVGNGGRVLGINSEMDALPGIGHACGHNLISIAGIGVAIGVKAALQTHDIPGKIVLLGTPAEEGGGGKLILLDRGGYEGMHACVMCHPMPGISPYAGFSSSLAMQNITVEYFGQTAHAAAAPWEGINALDAAFLAYSSISVLRQQIKPDHRVHGIVEGKDWAPNVIPDYAKMRWIVRAPTWSELVVLRGRLTACFEAAAQATSCKTQIVCNETTYYDLRQNSILAQEFADVVDMRYNLETKFTSHIMASTDFGNVTYAMPSIHPLFTILSANNAGNHTPAFANAARTPEAHRACITIIKGLAITGLRVLDDDEFFKRVKHAFEDNRKPV
jgi:amidohydrolase